MYKRQAYLDHQLGHGRVAELSQFLVARWAADPSSKPRLRKILVDGRVARIGLQDSCQLRNGMGVSAQPRALLREIGDYVELPSAGTCCGGADVYKRQGFWSWGRLRSRPERPVCRGGPWAGPVSGWRG